MRLGDQERACLFLVFLSHYEDFNPNFDHVVKNSRLYHEGIQSLHHLPFACDFNFR